MRAEELDPRGQAKRAQLLHAIAHGRFKPIGGKHSIDVHYISFTLDDGRPARYERFRNIDIHVKKPLAGSKIRERQDAAFARQGRTVPEFANDSERDQYLATRSGLLRDIPRDYVYIAGDMNDEVLVYLDPIGIPFAFGKQMKQRLEKETIEFFSMKQPTPPNPKDGRHKSHPAHLIRNGVIRGNV